MSADAPHGVSILDTAKQQLLVEEGACGCVVYLSGTQKPGAMEPRISSIRKDINRWCSLNNRGGKVEGTYIKKEIFMQRCECDNP